MKDLLSSSEEKLLKFSVIVFHEITLCYGMMVEVGLLRHYWNTVG